MYLHKEGKIAKYKVVGSGGTCRRYQRVDGPSGFPFDLVMYDRDAEPERLTKEEALQAAIDYHEAEGCALYLELYPAPEKGEWAFIAQDPDGDWCGYDLKPLLRKDQWEASAAKANGWDRISQSPPNPFWRKTLR